MADVNQEIIDKLLQSPRESAALLRTSLKLFIKVFHWYIFRKPFIFMPFHDEIINKLEDIAFDRAEKNNLYIGIAPRSGKSQIMQYFICWSYALNKSCNFIMTSYGDKLVLKFSGQSKAIIESDLYKRLFGIQCVKDTTAKDLWKIDGGGEFRATSMKGTITGFGCFDYNQIVMTENGQEKIGQLVESQKYVKVWSYNFKTKKAELKDINFFIKNKNQEFIRVIMNDGTSIVCTPDHNIWTNKGYVQAKDLLTGDFILPSNSLYNINRYTKFSLYVLIGMIFIYDIFRFGFCKNLFSWARIVASSLKSYACCFFSPTNSTFNIGNITCRKTKFFCNKFIWSPIRSNLSRLFNSNLMISIMSSMSNAISFIVRLCPIRKIFNSIVKRIPIKMSDAHSFFLFPNKSVCKKLMNPTTVSNSIYGKTNTFISFFVDCCRKYMPRNVVFDFSVFRNRVKPFIFRDRKPVVVYSIGHNFTSYCLNVSSNHNMFLGGCQQVLVKNCSSPDAGYSGALIIDDALKGDDYKSTKEKQNSIDIYTNTLKSRLNKPDAPIIVIAQRLAKDDLIGWIKDNEKDDWDFLVIPTLDENDESIWEDKFPAEKLKKMREVNPFLFYSQYQQEPIIMGGSVLKEEWFRFYPTYNNVKFSRMFMTADTALKIKEHNDFSVLALWGLTIKNELYLIDMIHGKWEAPDLERQFIAFWNKWRMGVNSCRPNAVYIEDKASGTGLIQSIKRKGGMPVIPIQPEKDKLTRVMDVSPYIESGMLYLPMSKDYDISKKLISECVAFSADMSHQHDDITDCMCYALDVAYRKKPIQIKDDWETEIDAINQ